MSVGRVSSEPSRQLVQAGAGVRPRRKAGLGWLRPARGAKGREATSVVCVLCWPPGALESTVGGRIDL